MLPLQHTVMGMLKCCICDTFEGKTPATLLTTIWSPYGNINHVTVKLITTVDMHYKICAWLFPSFSVCSTTHRGRLCVCVCGGLVAVNLMFIFLTLVYAPPTEIITVINILFAPSMSRHFLAFSSWLIRESQRHTGRWEADGFIISTHKHWKYVVYEALLLS